MKRRTLVGFIGRLAENKGTIDFVRAIPTIARDNVDVAFLIGGAGALSEWVVTECTQIKTYYSAAANERTLIKVLERVGIIQ
jgi:glycosyltransferase involved in cell wall biosynthesis